jgi:hypothetical protein
MAGRPSEDWETITANAFSRFLSKQAEDAAELKQVRWVLNEHLLRLHKIVIGFNGSFWVVQRAGHNVARDPSYAVVLAKALELIEQPSDDAERN